MYLLLYISLLFIITGWYPANFREVERQGRRE